MSGFGFDDEQNGVSGQVVDPRQLDTETWTNEDNAELPDETRVIRPFGWKMLVMPLRQPSVTKGGILTPLSYQQTGEYLSYCGRVVTLGPLCFRHRKFKEMGMEEEHKPRRGDWIVYGLYNYQRIDFKGTKLLLLNDDSFLGTVPEGVNPWDFKLER